jgi:hypothetical protein
MIVTTVVTLQEYRNLLSQGFARRSFIKKMFISICSLGQMHPSVS